jgi:hypothetical protein
MISSNKSHEFITMLLNKLEVKGFRIKMEFPETRGNLHHHLIEEIKSIIQLSTRVILPLLTTRQQNEFRSDLIKTLDSIDLALLEPCYSENPDLIDKMRKISNILQCSI